MRFAAALATVLVLAGCSTTQEPEPSVDAQLDYLLAHYDDRNDEEFGSLADTDCVNFTSQGLLARGWKMTDEWWHLSILGNHQYSKPWVSSTAFAAYLTAHPELASPIEADAAIVGDLVQFDYDDSGNRDHTATISRVDPDGTVFVVQHSPDADFKPVVEVLDEHGGGGTAYFWSLTD